MLGAGLLVAGGGGGAREPAPAPAAANAPVAGACCVGVRLGPPGEGGDNLKEQFQYKISKKILYIYMVKHNT